MTALDDLRKVPGATLANAWVPEGAKHYVETTEENCAVRLPYTDPLMAYREVKRWREMQAATYEDGCELLERHYKLKADCDHACAERDAAHVHQQKLEDERDALTARVEELGKALESAHASRNALVQSGDQSYHLAEALKAKLTEAERTITGMRAVVEAARVFLLDLKEVASDDMLEIALLPLRKSLSALDKPAAAEPLHDRIPTAEGRTRAAVAHRVSAAAAPVAEPREIRVPTVDEVI